MLIETAGRVETAAKEMLSLVNAGTASCAELREMLIMARSAAAMISAAQTSAAATISGRERHGDGGAQVLADTAGLTRRDAHSQVKTAEVLQAAPAVRDAVESGRVPQANAKRLAEAISKTSAGDVATDIELLSKAASMRPDQFVREARRWTADRQHDGGEADYRKLRARRSVRIFDGDDGMVHLRGEFDPVTGRRIANRLHHTAGRMHRHDQQNASSRSGEKRNLSQCLADALDDLTATGSGDGAASTGGGTTGSEDNEGTTGGGATGPGSSVRTPGSGSTTGSRSTAGSGDGATGSGTTAGDSGEPYADLCVVAHVDDETGKLIGELPDGSRLPQSVLDELTCNAAITGVIFDRCGKPTWHTTAGRRATETQRRILEARWGGCFHCRANFAICQPHHIDPVSRGGSTNIDNLVPACWGCHNLIHRDGWQIHKSPDGNHTLHPPQRIHHGPAHIPERPPPTITQLPPLFKPPRQHASEHEAQLFATEPDPSAPETADTETTPARPGSSDSTTTQTGPNSDDPETTQTGPGRGINGQWDLPRGDSETSRAGPDGSDAKTTRAGPAAARAALEAARAVLDGAQQTRNQRRPVTAR